MRPARRGSAAGAGWLVAAVVCCAAPAAAELELPPFRADDRVQVVPPGAFSTAAVDRAATHAAHRVFVVVLQSARDETLAAGRVSATEGALESIWTAWRADPAFDAREDLLVVLALDEREVRVRTGSRWDIDLGLHTTALESLIDTCFLPRARTGDLDGALAELVRGLDRAIEERLEEQREARRRRALLPWVLAGGGVLLLLGVTAAVAVVRRRRYRRARAEFESAAEALERELDHAEKEWAEFRVGEETRDQVARLRMKGPRTLALTDEVTRRVDEIAIGLDGLRGHLRACRERSRAAGWLDASGLRAATAALSGPCVFDTGQARQRLFHGDRRTVTIDPATFLRDLGRKCEEARAGWRKLQDAIETSLRTARQDFPTDDLDVMRSRLEAAGLPPVWLAHHPLDKDPQGEWTRLDALRQADPVAYLEQLFGRLDAQAALEADVAVLAEAVGEARRARVEALAVETGGPDTVVSGAARDPAAAAADAEQVTAMLELELQDGEDVERAVATARAARDAWREVGRRKRSLRGTAEQGAGERKEPEAEGGDDDGGFWAAVFGSSIGRHYGGRHYGGHRWGGGCSPGGGRSGGRSFSGGGRSFGGGRPGGRRSCPAAAAARGRRAPGGRPGMVRASPKLARMTGR